MIETENSKFGVFTLFMTGSLSFFALSVHVTNLGPIIPVLKQVYNDTFMERYGTPMPESTWLTLLSMTTSLFIAGAFVGGLSSKFILASMSGKNAFILTHATIITGDLIISLAGGIAKSYEGVIVGRIVVGLALGMSLAMVPKLMIETSAPSSRTKWQSFPSICLAFGFFFGPILAHPKVLGNIHLWPIVTAFPALPSLIYIIASFWLSETPFYLVRAGRKEEAEKVLKRLRKPNKGAVEEELNAIENEVNSSTTLVGIKEMLHTKQYRNQLIAVCGVYVGVMFTGINNFLFYTDPVFLQAGISPDNITYATIGVYALQVLASICGIYIVNRFAAYRANLWSTVITTFSLILFTVSQATLHLASNVMPYIAVVATAIYFVSYNAGLNISFFVLVGDLTTEPTRPTAFAFGSIFLWISSFIVGFLPPYLQVAFGAYSMVIWAVLSIGTIIFHIVFLPDTKGKTSDEIQAHFQ